MKINWRKVLTTVGTLGISLLLKKYRHHAAAKTLSELVDLGVAREVVPKDLQGAYDALARAHLDASKSRVLTTAAETARATAQRLGPPLRGGR